MPPIAPFLPLIGQGVNALSTLFGNSLNRAKELSDWNRVNEYNSPKSQMQRYKEAGLSPHLIYGQTNTAQPIKSTDYVAPQIQPETANVTAISQNLQGQKLQNDNLEKQLQVQDANVKLISANTAKAISETHWRNLNSNNFSEMFPTQLEGMKERNNLTRASIQKTIEDKNLTQDKQREVTQIIENLKTTNQLLGQKYITEKQQNEFVQKVDAVSKVGGLGIQLLRLLFK